MSFVPPPTIQNGIADLLRADPELMEMLPGGVWTRRIRKNDGTPEEPSKGSTPGAFDEAGRIKRCISVLNGVASENPIGPAGAYWAFPEIWMRCLPHQSEKDKLEWIANRVIELIQGARVPVPGSGVAVLRCAGRMMPDDDPDLPPAVVDMIRVQADGVWRM